MYYNLANLFLFLKKWDKTILKLPKLVLLSQNNGNDKLINVLCIRACKSRKEPLEPLSLSLRSAIKQQNKQNLNQEIRTTQKNTFRNMLQKKHLHFLRIC